VLLSSWQQSKLRRHSSKVPSELNETGLPDIVDLRVGVAPDRQVALGRLYSTRRSEDRCLGVRVGNQNFPGGEVRKAHHLWPCRSSLALAGHCCQKSHPKTQWPGVHHLPNDSCLPRRMDDQNTMYCPLGTLGRVVSFAHCRQICGSRPSCWAYPRPETGKAVLPRRAPDEILSLLPTAPSIAR
jgi:hypothetical protein